MNRLVAVFSEQFRQDNIEDQEMVRKGGYGIATALGVCGVYAAVEGRPVMAILSLSAAAAHAVIARVNSSDFAELQADEETRMVSGDWE